MRIESVETVHHMCPWCWVAVRQAERLKEELPTLELRWVAETPYSIVRAMAARFVKVHDETPE